MSSAVLQFVTSPGFSVLWADLSMFSRNVRWNGSHMGMAFCGDNDNFESVYIF